MKKIWIACFLIVAFAFAAAAADVAGKWTAQVPGRGGDPVTTNITLQVDGAKLTGTISTPQGETKIEDGKVDGDKISFVTNVNFGGNAVKIIYKGTVSGAEIKFTREREGGQAREFVAKRPS